VVTSTLDLQEVLDESFAALRRLIDFDGGAIQLIDDEHLVAAATDPPATPEALTVRIPVGAGISGTIALTGDPIYIPDIVVDERVHPEGRRKGLSGGVRSYFGAPLIERGTPIGVVQIDSRAIDAFDPAARETMLAFLPTITAAVQNARLFAHEQAAHDRLAELDRQQRDFMAMISHELRTPMSTIMGYARRLTDEDVDADDMRTFGRRIDAAATHLSRLIGDVLAVSGIGLEGHGDEPQPTSLRPLVEESLAMLGQPTDRVRLVLPQAELRVVVSRGRLQRVLASLVDNALKFGDGPVEVRAAPQPDHIDLAVVDRGPGIPPELHERVFERFFQADRGTTRRHGGMGIGLFLARTLCDRMGLQLRLDSTPGRAAPSRWPSRWPTPAELVRGAADGQAHVLAGPSARAAQPLMVGPDWSTTRCVDRKD
jgi:signal transduction histidine kinase